MGWLSGWAYKREITITEQSGSTLTDYQIKIELNSSNFDFSKANDDGSDIRFTEDDGTTLLSYWIEKWDNTNEEATIWVKVPSIPANGETTVYLYYGNSEATSESDGEAVFDLFDDFEGDSLDTSKWNIGKGNANGNVEIVDDNGVSALLLDPVDNVTNACAVYTKTAFLINGFIVEERRKFTDPHYVDIGLCKDEPADFTKWHIKEGASQNEYAFQMQNPIGESGDAVNVWKEIDGTFTKLAYTADRPLTSTGAYHLTRVIYTQDGKLIYEHIASTGEQGWHLEATDTTFLNDPKYLLLWQGEYENGNGGASYIDWVRVRKYAEQEPSISVGSETSPTISGIVKLPNGTPVQGATVISIREDTYEIVDVTTSESDGSYTLAAAGGVNNTVIVIPSTEDQNGDIKCHIQPA